MSQRDFGIQQLHASRGDIETQSKYASHEKLGTQYSYASQLSKEAGAYASRSEFVKEAIRRHLEAYGLTKVLFQELLKAGR